MTKRTKQILSMSIVVVLAIVAGGSLFIYLHLKNSIPQTNGEIVIDGISDRIEITYDKMGIAQIWAESETDGYFALGWMHASDRMFQMDMARRMAEGRLSELLGEVTLESDKRQRMVGHNRLAKAALPQLSESNRKRLEAYAQGANAYKKVTSSLPFEYLLLGSDFKEWTVSDCLTLLSFQTWYSDALQNHDRFYQSLQESIGAQKATTMCYNYPDWAPVTIPESKKMGWNDSKSWPLESPTPNPYSMSFASNAWVVGPSKSASGHAMLSSDPHLHIGQLPQFWYMVGLHIRETNMNALGISTPGLPYITMGHNGQSAWAFTAGGIQVTKSYQEKLNPDDSTQYLTPTGWTSFENIVDTIVVSDFDSPVILNTKLTRHGPIISESNSDSVVISLHWAGYDIDLNLACQSGFELQSVNSFEKFREIVTSLGALNANWIYADSGGNIGYQLGTPIFDNPGSPGCFPSLGWANEFNWQKYYAPAKSPFSLNPPQAWLASCNNLAARSSDFPVLFGSFAPDRIMRISELLKNSKKLTSEDFKSFQLDRVDSYLLRWQKEISRLALKQGEQALADMFGIWDGSTDSNSRETAICITFLAQLKRLTFEDDLGELYQGVRTIWLDHIYHDSTLHFWFDDISTEKIETRDEIALKALSKSIEIVGQKTWGQINSLSMRHPMAAVPIISGLLDLDKPSQPWSGTASTLNASYVVPTDDNLFQTIVGPSWRFVIDFADVDAAQFVLPAGNSGNPMSPHFFDFNQIWQNGEYWNVPITYERVNANAVSTLYLVPTTGAK